MTLSIQIAKFEFCQYQLRAILPNLMFAKITHSYSINHAEIEAYNIYSVFKIMCKHNT